MKLFFAIWHQPGDCNYTGTAAVRSCLVTPGKKKLQVVLDIQSLVVTLGAIFIIQR